MRSAIADWTSPAGDSSLPHGLQFPRRARQHHHGRCARDDDAGRGAHRVEDDGPGRHQRLFTIGGQHRFGIHAGIPRHQPGDDVSDLGFEPGVQNQFPLAEPGHDLDRHVVGGRPETAAGDDEIDSLVGKEPKLRLDVGGAVAAQRDVPQFHTQLE